MLTSDRLQEMAKRLLDVPGMEAVTLGGSRARDTHTPRSDVDLGLYYRSTVDVDALQAVAIEIAGTGSRVTEPGAWGPWVNGGGWLRIDGTAVDWIYRDLDRVQTSWRAARTGEVSFHHQLGHPLGVLNISYAGEVALGQILADSTGELTQLQLLTRTYPEPLAAALIATLGDARFTLSTARKALDRDDSVYISGCLFRAVELCALALHGAARRWWVNEKGGVAAAGHLAPAPVGFAARAAAAVGALGPHRVDLEGAIERTQTLVADVAVACEATTPR